MCGVVCVLCIIFEVHMGVLYVWYMMCVKVQCVVFMGMEYRVLGCTVLFTSGYGVQSESGLYSRLMGRVFSVGVVVWCVWCEDRVCLCRVSAVRVW